MKNKLVDIEYKKVEAYIFSTNRFTKNKMHLFFLDLRQNFQA